VLAHSIMRTNVVVPEKLRNLKPTQFYWLALNLSSIFALLKILRWSISQTAISDPCHFWPMPLLCQSNTLSLTPLFCCYISLSLSLTLFHLPTLFSTVVISYKYPADFMRQFHCNKLIARKRSFHLGIPHNTTSVHMENNLSIPAN
jgi:hypothetical protein